MRHFETIPDANLLSGILGLRGIAALAVVLFHLCHLTGIAVPPIFQFIARDFGYGAHLFFVLSAFSLMHSTSHTMQRRGWVNAYLIKRFFRIAPLFYLVLLCMLVGHFWRGTFPDFLTIFLNFFFLFGFVLDPAVCLVWAGWTIGVEMIFYAMFPLLLITVKSKRDAAILLIAATAIGYGARTVLHAQYLQTVPPPRWDGSYFNFLSNLYFFAVGIWAYKMVQHYKQTGAALPLLFPAAAILILALLFVGAAEALTGGGRLDLILWACGFGALCIWQSVNPGRWSANRFFEYLGERSFSVYLLHPLVITVFSRYLIQLNETLQPTLGNYAYFVCAAALTAVLLCVAEISYRAIEVPGIRLGRRIIQKNENSGIAVTRST